MVTRTLQRSLQKRHVNRNLNDRYPGRGKEDAEDLVVVGRADTEKNKCRCIMDDASDMADGQLYQVKRTARELAQEWEISNI